MCSVELVTTDWREECDFRKPGKSFPSKSGNVRIMRHS